MTREYETTTVKGGHTIYTHKSIEERREDREEIKDLKERLVRVESLLMQRNRYFDEGEYDFRKVISEESLETLSKGIKDAIIEITNEHPDIWSKENIGWVMSLPADEGTFYIDILINFKEGK